jgi:hypothetical protein
MFRHRNCKTRLSAIRILAVALCGPGVIFAQGLGSIVGTVTDPSGGVVPGAAVRITDEGTSTVRESVTNTQGLFVIPSLRPSTYTVSTTIGRFANFVRRGSYCKPTRR